MAITGIDQLIAGMQFPRFFTKAVTPTLVAGRPHSLWYLGGNPAAGSMNTVHISPVTGATVTATRSIDGGAFAACANSATEVSGGVYKINLAASDLNGDVITLKFSATGADSRIITIVTNA